jgi:hypothetical protein
MSQRGEQTAEGHYFEVTENRRGTLYRNRAEDEEALDPETKRLPTEPNILQSGIDLQNLSNEPKFGNFGLQMTIVKSPAGSFQKKGVSPLAGLLDQTIRLQDAELQCDFGALERSH